MFLFRRGAEPAEDAGDHEPIDVTNAAHAEPQEEEEVVSDSKSAGDAEEGAQQGNDVRGDSEDALHGTRENTVPPLEERHIVQQHQHEVEAEEAAQASASAPLHAATVPGLAMPRTHATATAGKSSTPRNTIQNNGNGVRRGSRGTTPRVATPRAAADLSPRSHSRGGYSFSYSGSALSAEEMEVRGRHYRHCSSVVQSARSISDRRASSVNRLVGSIDGGIGNTRRRSGSMTAAEREAVERMVINELHRQEAVERSEQFGRMRETMLVETELAKEKASYEHLVDQQRKQQEEIVRRSSLREQRTITAAQRRKEMDEMRQQLILDSVHVKEMRYAMLDPYAVTAAQRRYRSPIAPARRTSSPGYRLSDSRRASEGVNVRRSQSASADYRRNSAPVENIYRTRPGIDMSPPKQCLPLSAWKTPEQLKTKKRAGTFTQRCLPPGAWKALTVVDHPRQWH
ncbi:hypothetical protein ABL78_7520 [Leptomonas seymouri]|uniref:Uncharacterized protein n=1 Tax=Leptomonas seymouri TaxID=5684 RepID=A0A0N1HZG0_LEPSE|nr:hypothetical protein ABL78_7520 [Leptomonas seymouri]|eukprot:KPI83450.1 hypothetical protein ABL78_7520 [Leptomonas seymouri]